MSLPVSNLALVCRFVRDYVQKRETGRVSVMRYWINPHSKSVSIYLSTYPIFCMTPFMQVTSQPTKYSSEM